jgi:hypothetical protein
MAVDQVAVVLQRFGFDLHRMGFDPVIEVRADGDRAAVDVPALVCFDPGVVSGGFGFFLRSEAAHPLGFADAGLGVLDADDVGPGGSALHDATAELGSGLAGHYAAVLSASSLET